MAATEKPSIQSLSQDVDFGLLAHGSSGAWEIAIDKALSGPDRWQAQIDGPSVSIYFAIPSIDIVDKVSRFLAPHVTSTVQSSNGAPKGCGSLLVGSDKKSPVTLIEDDEYDDRLFLVIGATEGPMIRLVLTGMDLAHFAEALRQVKVDLDDSE